MTTLATVLLFSTLASGDWKTTFEPRAVASYLDAAQQAVVVVAAGDSLDEAKAAASALRDGLRASGKTRLVMDDASLGGVWALADEKIAAKAAALPIDQVAIVRVFPGGPGKPWSSVVTFYDKAGKALTALSGEAGTAIASAAGAGGLGVSRGVSTAALDAISHVGQADPKLSAAQEQYDRRFIWFGDSALVSVSTGQIVSTWSDAYRGKYRELLSQESFLEAVGHPEIARDIRNTRTPKALLLVGGLVAATVGLTWGLIAATSFPCERRLNSTSQCTSTDFSGAYVPGGLLIGGIAAMIGSAFIHVPTVQVHEARRMAEEYNEQLKKELGLPTSASREPTAEPKLSFGAFVGPQAAGVSLGVSL